MQCILGDQSPRLRMLFVSDELPFPHDSGYRLRMAQHLRGLSQVADVDVYCAVLDRQTLKQVPSPEQLGVSRLRVQLAGWRARGASTTAAWLLGSRPRQIANRDWNAARADLRRWARPDYDLVWFSHAGPFSVFSEDLPLPSVVDLDNLEDVLLKQRRAAERGGRRRLRWDESAVRALERIDEPRWTALNASLSRALAVVVCSELDRTRLGLPNTVVVPNGYRLDTPPVGRPWPWQGPPSLVLVGNMAYGPNEDAAWWCATRVLPIVHRTRPDVELRIVGQDPHGKLARRLSGLAGVTVVGSVPDVRPHLAAASVAVVPVRYGSGTRLKVLEAFAHRVPVVSTALGSEGLGVTHDAELLVADEPGAFAAACLVLLDDEHQRRRLTAAAEAVWRSRFDADLHSARVAALVRELAVTARIAQ